MSLRLARLGGRFAVCRASAGADPAGMLSVFAASRTGRSSATPFLVALVQSDQELSLVCPEGAAPRSWKIEAPWTAFRVAGPLDFSLTGILSSLASPLAAAGIPIFAVSSFDTDYLLVKEERAEAAVATLIQAGFEVSG